MYIFVYLMPSCIYKVSSASMKSKSNALFKSRSVPMENLFNLWHLDNIFNFCTYHRYRSTNISLYIVYEISVQQRILLFADD